MNGYIYSGSDNVGNLRTALQGVTGFSIIKELIQNADDSGARNWLMGYTDGVSVCHPLLQCPAIYVINDGSFEPKHAEGLARIYRSTKAGEGDSVGKFGLGLKSVHQLCEAFFFWPSSSDSHKLEYPGFSMISPWTINDKSEREDWEKDFKDCGADDIVKIRQHLKERDFLDGFTLWIPLRQQGQLEVQGSQKRKSIYKTTYENGTNLENIFSSDLMDRLASLWPMLRHIKKMEVRAPHQKEPAIITLSSQAQTRQYPQRVTKQDSSNVIIEVNKGDSCDLIALPKTKQCISGVIEGAVQGCFKGFELGVDIPELLQLRRSENWPVRGLISGDEENIDVPDKSTPHAAAVFQLLEQESDTQSHIHWAVFFPVGDAQSLDILLQGVRIQLLLHGFFLLDADRKRISTLHDGKLQEVLEQNQDNLDSQQKLEHLWNAKLATEGTLKLVLPALEAFAKQLEVIDAATHEERITALTQALQDSDFFKKDYRQCQYLTTERQWVKRVNAGARATWQLVEASVAVFKLSQPDVAFQIFPELKTLCETHVFIEAESPSLTKSKPRKEWTNEILEPCLAAADVGKMQELLQAEDDDTLAANIKNIKAVLKHIPQTHRLKLPSLDLLEKLRGVSLGVALIPPEVGIPCDANLSIEGAEVILRKLENIPDISEFIITVIKACKEADKNDLADSINDLKIFEVTSVQGEPRWLSLQNLIKAPLLFKKRGSDTFGTKLDAVLDDTYLALIDNTVANELENFDLEIKSCNQDASIGVLEAKPRLVTESEPRLELFHKLRDAFKQRPNPTQVQALRYLLHADREHFKDDAPLFMPSSEDEGVWNRLCQKILTIQAKEWCWLEELAGLHTQISSNEQGWYQLEVATSQAVENLLKKRNEGVPLPALGDEEYDALLKDIKDINLLKRLPIHETESGERVAITENTYFASGQQDKQSKLFEGIQFVTKHKHPRLVLRQKELGIKKLNDSDVVEQALNKNYSHRFLNVILKRLKEVSEKVKERLKSESWLKIQDNKPCAPNHVIYFADENLQEHANRLMDTASGKASVFVRFEDLHQDIREHEHVKGLINEVLPERKEALASVCSVLSETSEYDIGELSGDDDSDEIIKKWLQAFDDSDVFPVWDWLKHVQPNERGKIWHSVTKEIDAEKINEALKYLRERHQQGSKDKEVVLEVHNWYLERAAKTPAWQLTDDVLLLNQVGDWCEPSKLCHGQMGVHKGDLVCEAQAEILKDILERNASKTVSTSSQVATTEKQNTSRPISNDAPRILKSYFHPWRNTDLDDAVVGVLLALLGVNSEVEELAKSFLGNYPLDTVRQKLGVKDIFEKDRCRAVVDKAEGEKLLVNNLLGDTFEARQDKTPDALFAGEPKRQSRYAFELTLADFVPNVEAPELLKRMIRASVVRLLEIVLEDAESVSAEAVDKLLDTVSDTSQLSLTAAQNLILEHAIFYIKGELRANSDELTKLFARWNEARIEGATSEAGKSQQQRQTEDDIKQNLKNLLDSDEDTQNHLRECIRQKLKTYQYKAESIPFELFQNADDALVELSVVREPPSKAFIIKTDDYGDVYVMHWGRCINDGLGKRNTDYYRDLEKMLTLSSSDKTAQVTGKFGLGFKSVFFLSDTPQIISGNLNVKIVGGVYPKRLTDSDFLRGELAKHGDKKQGTLIYLPTDEQHKEVAGLLEKFRHLAPYMLLFTRAADRCEIISGENEHKTTMRWQEKVVLPNVVTKQYNGTTVLQFTTKDNKGSVVFKVGHKGIERFENIPTLWVTAPTEEDSKLGFLINGDFDVDVGRAQLARSSSKNGEIAKQMARELAEAFKKLAAMEWETLCSALELKVSKEDFWRSFFDCLTQGFDDDKPVVELARQIFWGHHGAASQLLKAGKVLPSIKKDAYPHELTRPSDVRRYLKSSPEEDIKTPNITRSYEPVPIDVQKQALERDYKRWIKNVERKIADYDDTVYPFSLELRLDYDLDDELQRKSWLVLFMRASFITLGWDTPSRHRGFLQFCEQEGWLDVFSEKTQNPDPHKWMGVIDAYFDKDSGKYRHWMTQFVTIYQLSKWLDKNVSLVAQLSQAKEKHNIEGIWQPRTLSTLSGFGDYDIPSLMKPLRLGKHFIMRELVRKNVLNNPALYPYCFVPSEKVCRHFAHLGCDVCETDSMQASQDIFNFVKHHIGEEKATYAKCFDIPFVWDGRTS